MTSVLSSKAFHPSVGHAFAELRLLDEISALPDDSVLRILQSIPDALLQEALSSRASAPEPAAAVAERRLFPRRKLLRGAVVMQGGVPLLDVQLRDISEGGCRIWTRSPHHVPDCFTIRIVGITGERACDVRWRAGEDIGVRFLTA